MSSAIDNRKIKIKFNDEDNRIKGLGIMWRSKLGFSGVGKNLYFVPIEMLDKLYESDVEFTVLDAQKEGGYNTK